MFSLRRALWASWTGLRDGLREIRGGAPLYAPLTAPPGGYAALVDDDAEAGYARLVPERSTWQNRYAARFNLRFARYRPVKVADRIACPLLVCVCDRDHVTPPGPAVAAAERAPRGEVAHYDARHFDIYVDGPFERAVADQRRFLERHLTVGSPLT